MQEKDRIMLELDDVKKDYVAGDTVVHALKGFVYVHAVERAFHVHGGHEAGEPLERLHDAEQVAHGLLHGDG